MTAQEPAPASVDPGPPPSASDLLINPDNTASPQSIHYLSPDGTYHTARAPQNGWWVDTDSSGKSRLTLSINYLDPYQKSWVASRAGSSILLSKDLDANPADLVATTTFQYVDKDASGNLVPRNARLMANAAETWSITGNAANIGGDSVALQLRHRSMDERRRAIKVDVGPNGQPWIVNKQGVIFNRTRGQTGYVDGTWQVVPGSATDIAVGADGWYGPSAPRARTSAATPSHYKAPNGTTAATGPGGRWGCEVAVDRTVSRGSSTRKADLQPLARQSSPSTAPGK
jgi:hypothetical protein